MKVRKQLACQRLKKNVSVLKNRKVTGLDEATGEILKMRATGCVTSCGDCVIEHL